MENGMDLHGLGELFRQKRESSGLSLDEVIDRTKISRRNILAIEEGRKETLPHSVYSKGFIRNYGRLLGIDENLVNQVLSDVFPPEDDTFDDGFVEPIETVSSSRKGKGSLLPIVIGLILLVVTAVVAVYVVMGTGGEQKAATSVEKQHEPAALQPQPLVEQPPVEVVEEVAEVPVSEESQGNLTEETDLQENVSAAHDQVAPGSESQADEDGADEAVSKVVVPEADEQQATAVADSSVADEGVVILKAVEPCWLQATVDAQKTHDYLLRPGETLRLRFDQKMSIRLGNGGGVKVTYNGKPYNTDAKSGEVKTLVFP